MSDQAQGLRALVDRARRDLIGARAAPAEPDLPAPADLRDVLASAHAQSAVLAAPARVAVADTRLHQAASPASHARVIAVTSGKGGVGKTNVSCNLALTLARTGQRVIVLDADLGLANLHVVLGVTPRFGLDAVMRGECALRDALCDGPGGIRIIGGGSGIAELANLDAPTRDLFISGLRELDALADVILLDTGAGLSHNVMAFLCAVDEIVVITTPEPTALTDAYATIKVASRENPGARQMLVVNMAQSEAEGQAVADRLSMIAGRFLGMEMEYLGCVLHDPHVSRAVRAQQPFVLEHPNVPAAQCVARIAARLGYRRPTPDAPGAGVGGLLKRMHRFLSHGRPQGGRV